MRILALALAAALGVGSAGAAERSRPGAFDFYVLSLSWSPSFCEAEGRFGNDEQCSTARPYAFVVHGLWPQNERGWPEFCRTDERRVERGLEGRMMDLMPSRDLIRHQWRKHGACSGLSQRGYFQKVRDARARLRIPPLFAEPQRPVRISPGEAEAAFSAANPGLGPNMMAVGCSGNRLREVRICLDKALDFKPCPEVDRRACSRRDLVMPPVRAGRR